MRSGERPAPGEPVELFDGAADPAPIDVTGEPAAPPPDPAAPLPVEK